MVTPMTEAELAAMTERNGRVITPTYAVGAPLRKQYELGIKQVAAALLRCKVKPETPGAIEFVNETKPEERYFPSMLAIQLLLENDTAASAESKYTDELKTINAETVALVAGRLYANDARLGDLPWYTAIDFQKLVPHVYQLLRNAILSDRRARDAVCITRVAEKRALDALIQMPDLIQTAINLNVTLNNFLVLNRGKAVPDSVNVVKDAVKFIDKEVIPAFLDALAPPVQPGQGVPEITAEDLDGANFGGGADEE